MNKNLHNAHQKLVEPKYCYSSDFGTLETMFVAIALPLSPKCCLLLSVLQDEL